MRAVMVASMVMGSVWAVSGAESGPAAVFRVADFGAVGDGQTDDGPAIRRAIDAAVGAGRPATVLFDNKIYRVGQRDDQWESFELIDTRDITIDGNGAMLILSPNNRGFLLDRATNCTIQNFVIDVDPLPFTQGDVTAVYADKATFDVRLHPGYPDPPEQEWMVANYGEKGGWRHGCVMDPNTRTFTTRIFGGFIRPKSVHRLDEAQRVYRIESEEPERVKGLAVGDRFVFRVRYVTRERNEKLKGLPIATFRITHSADCLLSNIRQYCSPDMWIHLHDNVGRITIDGCRICYKPGTTRLVTSLSDGIHCSSSRAGPVIQNCFFEGLMDDSINISRMEDAVIEVRSETVFRLQSMAIAWFVDSMEPGDELLAFDRHQGRTLGRGRVLEVSERQGHRRTVRLDTPIPNVQPQKNAEDEGYTCFYNLSASGSGYVIRRNVFLAQMRSAMLLRSSGVIEDNYIDDVGGLAVFNTNEMQFREGPIPDGTIIRRNRVVNCRHHPAFHISSTSYNHQRMEPLARNILIEDNDVTILADFPAVRLQNVRDVTIRNNTFSLPPKMVVVEARNSTGIVEVGNVVNRTPSG